MHLRRVRIRHDLFPLVESYPFSLEILRASSSLNFASPVTFFAGENGSGKSTLLKAIARWCGIHIWEGIERARLINNPHEEGLSSFLEGEWSGGQPVPGSFFSAELFRSLAQSIDEWAINDPEVLSVYGGKSLLVQSHGQSYMSFFVNRFRIRGLYLLDEPENALSASTLFEFLELLVDLSRLGESQFLIATHSPILMSLRGSELFSFDKSPLAKIPYMETKHFKLYKAFFDKHGQPQ